MLVTKINFPPQAAFSMEVACLTALYANPMWKKACSRKLTCSETGCGCVIVRRNKVSPRHWSNSPSDLLHRTLLFQILYSQYAPAFGSTKLFFMLLLSLMALGLIIQQWKWNNYRTINLRYRSKRRNDIDHFIWRIFAGSTCAYPQVNCPLGDLLDCFYCLSIWVAIPFACLMGNSYRGMFFLWLGFSAGVCGWENDNKMMSRWGNMPIWFQIVIIWNQDFV